VIPGSFDALTVLILGVAPGYMGIRGYSRRRYRSVPDRDLYALAGAVVVSAIWLAAIWLFLLAVGDPLKHWGLVPYGSRHLHDHRADAVWLGLAVVLTPYPLGAFAAEIMDRLSRVNHDPSWKLLRKTGFFRPPTAWDRAWLQFTRKQEFGEVLVRLNNGLMIRGAYDSRAQADLSPNPPGLHLASGFGYRMADDGQESNPEAVAPLGVYIQGSEIAAVYFLEGEDAGGAGGDDGQTNEQLTPQERS